MRKLIAVLTVFLVLSSVFAFDVGDEPAVSIRDGDLRSTPGFLSRITTQVDYGESVKILEVRGDWLRVRAAGSGDEGWLHSSVVAEKEELRLERAGDATAAGVSTREIALAGRGFNEQVEAQYKSDKGLDFTLVDEMEEYGRPVEELAAFFADAGMTVEDGGAQ
ncbi:MAG: SH3 domain-containing protein [Spirochaetaceae bacterium]|nr:SH3 domain-containing protein [Spirochaetaceae bacterium]